MKTIITAIIMAFFATTVGTVTGQAFDTGEVKNRSILASPRAKEVFPSLRGTPATVTRDATKTALADIKNNRAVLASPRALEHFPELRLNGRPRAVTSEADELAAIRANKALTASPRMVELFPALGRAAAPEIVCTCEVAVVK